MKVKDIILRALKYAGREDVAKAVSEDDITDGECAETVETLLYCFCAVEDELARFYFPVAARESFSSFSGKYEFGKFAHRPVRIVSVTSGGKEVKYELFPTYLKADAFSVDIEYEYSPSKKTIGEDSEFSEDTVSEKMLAAGTASEYCLICGEMSLAEYFEKVYRREIEVLSRKSLSGVRFPPRRWV